MKHPGVRRVADQPGQHLTHARCARNRGGVGAARSSGRCRARDGGWYRSCAAARANCCHTVSSWRTRAATPISAARLS